MGQLQVRLLFNDYYCLPQTYLDRVKPPRCNSASPGRYPYPCRMGRYHYQIAKMIAGPVSQIFSPTGVQLPALSSARFPFTYRQPTSVQPHFFSSVRCSLAQGRSVGVQPHVFSFSSCIVVAILSVPVVF